MHQHCFNHGFSAFFERPAHRLGRDRVHHLQGHQLGRQQLQGPVRASGRRLRAGQPHQLGLGHPVQLGRARRARLALQGRLHAFQDQGLARPVHGHGGHAHGLRRAFVGPGRALRPLVAEQPDLGPPPGQRPGRAGGRQLLQVRSFLGFQFNQEALVGHGACSATREGCDDRGRNLHRCATHPCYTLH